MTVYVPGTEETDQKKQNISLQQIAAKLLTVGEYFESAVASGSAVSLVTGVPKTITSLSLGVGDWDVSALFQSAPANTTVVSQFAASYSLVNNSLDISPGRVVSPPMVPVTYDGSTGTHIPGALYRFNLAVTTTIYFVGYAAFTTSTCSAFGVIRARRAAVS